MAGFDFERLNRVANLIIRTKDIIENIINFIISSQVN